VLKLEHFEILRILAAILKMASKMTAILKSPKLDKCDLKMAAIAAIMVAILTAIFNMVAKTHNKFRSAPMLQLQRKLIFRGF
jgi:hypothetical protein